MRVSRAGQERDGRDGRRGYDGRGRLVNKGVPELLHGGEAFIDIHCHGAINSIGHVGWNVWRVVVDRLEWVGATTTHLRCAIEGVCRDMTCQQGVDGCAETVNIGAWIRPCGVVFGRTITGRSMADGGGG